MRKLKIWRMRLETWFDVEGHRIDVMLCWTGKDPEADAERFYDFYDCHGNCLNEDSPWYHQHGGIPTVYQFLDVWKVNKNGSFELLTCEEQSARC